jgi:hypothetical protein
MKKQTIMAACLILSLTVAAQAQTIGLIPAADAPLRPLTAATPIPPTDLVQAFRDAAGVFEATLQSEPPLSERVLALNLDPKAAFALIRDQVQSLPYGGRLRGPEAVLIAGSGNAHDKAAALADILGRMGHDTRLVTAGAALPPDAITCAGGWDDTTWQVTGLGPQVLDRAELRAAASYAALRPLLDPRDQPGDDPGPHIWLQIREAGAWVDLDPWSRANAWGDHPAGEGQPLMDLPAPQVVQITLTVERLQDGALSRDEILSSRLEMPEAAGALVSLSFGPSQGGLGGTMADVLTVLEGGAGEMVANLMINDRTEKSSAFAVPGTAATAPAFLADPAQAVTTGLWLTVSSLVPGAPDRSEVRPILDLLPEPVRQAAAGGARVEASALRPAIPGERYPAALESLRQFAISDGGTSRRLTAARVFLQLRDLPAVLDRSGSGQPTPWDVIWASYLEAQRISLAAEAAIAARPAHDGACAGVMRPRVLIWGLAPTGGEEVSNWLDWVLDDLGVVGGDATAQAEMRLWHGSVAAGLEKEALFWLADVDGSTILLDTSPMQPRDPAVMGFEGMLDQAMGYLTVADAAYPDAIWWRVNPATGHSDARFAIYGNTWIIGGYLMPGGSVGGSTGATWFISEAEQAALYAETEFGYDSLIDAAMRQIEGVEGAERSRPKGGGDANGYVTIASNVSIPSSVSTGSGVSRTVMRVFRRPR